MAQAAFTELLRTIAAQYPSKKAFAAALEIDAGHLNHVMRGREPFGVTTCLRLALLIERSPIEILRLADQTDEALLVDALYGPPASDLTAAQRYLLAIWDRIPSAAWPVRDDLLRALKHLGMMPANSHPPRSRRRRTTAHK